MSLCLCVGTTLGGGGGKRGMMILPIAMLPRYFAIRFWRPSLWTSLLRKPTADGWSTVSSVFCSSPWIGGVNAFYDRGAEVNHFFSEASSLWELKKTSPQKLILEKSKTATYRMKSPSWPRHTTRIMQKKRPIIYFFSDDFGLRRPRHSETISGTKMGIP